MKLRITVAAVALAACAAASHAPAVDPSVYRQLKFRYAGSAPGGIFKSEDAGTTWKTIFADQPVSSVGSLAVAHPTRTPYRN